MRGFDLHLCLAQVFSTCECNSRIFVLVGAVLCPMSPIWCCAGVVGAQYSSRCFIVYYICHARCIGCACGFGLLEVVLFDGAFVLDVWHF